MAEVDATEEVVPQQSVYGISSQPATSAPPPTQPAATTISLDDLMRMSSVPSSNSKESEGWESDATASEVEDEGDEEQQERDRLEFMKAIRGLHGAPAAAPAAASSAAAEPAKSSTLEREAAPGEVKSAAAAVEAAEPPNAAKEAKKGKQLGRMFGDEGDVMEEHEREVPCLLTARFFFARFLPSKALGLAP